jgi:flagellar hook-associated protein 2
MGVGVDGIVSGLDTTAIIDAILGIQVVQKESLEARIDVLEETQEALASLNALLGTLSETVAAMDSVTEFREYASTTQATEFDVTISSDALPGSYQIEVAQLASSAVSATDNTYSSVSDASVIEDGAWSINLAGVVTDVDVDSSMTLEDVVTLVNDVAGVTAYILDTDGGSNFRFVVSADDTGEENTLTMKGPTGATTFSAVRDARDAMITIDGMEISSADNQLADIIPGFDLELTQVTTSAQTVTVELDTETIEANIQGFVDAYNDVANFIDIQTVYNAGSGIRGDLVGESVVRRLESALRSTVSTAYEGLGTDLDALALIGIETNENGKMVLDSEEFNDALLSNQGDVEALFTDEDGFATQFIASIDTYIDPYDGSLQLREDSLDTVIKSFQDKVDAWEARLVRYEERLRSQFAALESFLSYAQSTQAYLASLFNDSVYDD